MHGSTTMYYAIIDIVENKKVVLEVYNVIRGK